MPKLNLSEQSTLKSMANTELVTTKATVEEAWWKACLMMLNSKGYEVVKRGNGDEGGKNSVSVPRSK